MAKNSQITVITFAILSIVVLFIVLMAYSFAVVPTLNAGLLYDSATKQLDLSPGFVHLPGRYYLGPGRSFLLIPTRRVNIIISDNPVEYAEADFTETSILARSQDGLQVKMDIFCQIKLIDAEKLSDPILRENIEKTLAVTAENLNFYSKDNAYLRIITSILTTEALDAVSLFASSQIYTNRSQLSSKLNANFQLAMADFGITVPVLIITNIAFTSNDIITAIEATQILNQDVLKMRILEGSKRLQLNYSTQVNQYDNQNALNAATTQAQASMIVTNGTANGLNLAYNNLIAGIQNAQSTAQADDMTINFLLYLAVFKNTFSGNQTVLLTKAGFF